MKTEERLLKYFKENEGKIITRDELFSEIWRHKKDSEYFNGLLNNTRTIDVHVSKLRKQGYRIETIHNVGYAYNI